MEGGNGGLSESVFTVTQQLLLVGLSLQALPLHSPAALTIVHPTPAESAVCPHPGFCEVWVSSLSAETPKAWSRP